MSPEQKKEWPCVFHYTKEGGCLKGKECPYSHNPKHKHKDSFTEEGRGLLCMERGKVHERGSLHIQPANPKASAPAPNAKQQAKAQAKPKAAAPAIVRKVHIAMPATTVKRAATSETEKGDEHAEESEAEVKTVYHDRDAEDAISESSRWSGETAIPEKYKWFLGNDVSEEVEYLKNEDDQWRSNLMWYKGSFEDTSQSASKPVRSRHMIIDDTLRIVTRRHSSEPRL